MTQCEGFTFFIFFEFLMLDSKHGQNGGRARYQLEVESCKTIIVSLIKSHAVYLKMIFVKNLEQITKHLQFKFDRVPPKSAETCLFFESWLESSWMQPVGELYLKCDLIFLKMVWYHFETHSWYMLHKKLSFRHSENRKWFFYEIKLKASFENIVCHVKTYMCAQYRLIQTNYSMDLAITWAFAMKFMKL